MRAFIRKIVIFSSSGEKREVDLTPGLNVITGDSKTGKSALIEIVDYCLFSSRSSIPKGRITEFASLFVVVLKTEEKSLVVARPAPNLDWSKAYFQVETDDKFLNNFQIEYFDRIEPRTIKTVQADVEHHLGLSVADMTEDIDATTKVGKASMRSFMSFLFQHQNLLANKHALFYRFDDYSKRQQTIAQFPVLMNWVDGRYYALIRGLEDKQRKLKAEKKLES